MLSHRFIQKRNDTTLNCTTLCIGHFFAHVSPTEIYIYIKYICILNCKNIVFLHSLSNCAAKVYICVVAVIFKECILNLKSLMIMATVTYSDW